MCRYRASDIGMVDGGTFARDGSPTPLAVPSSIKARDGGRYAS